MSTTSRASTFRGGIVLVSRGRTHVGRVKRIGTDSERFAEGDPDAGSQGRSG
ncbi:hypothetical protein CZ774_14395 [Frigoribacterium sp. JB110]|nr:hypothetical protein CZ774_14395 [Frigoribacterium sp. JB110]